MKKPLLPTNYGDGKTKVDFKPDLATELLSKYTNSAQTTRKPPSPSFIYSCWFPTNLISICKFVMSSNPPKMKKPAFSFSPTSEAAASNWAILESFDLDFTKAIEAEKGSQLYYGSEFKDVTLLDLIFE